jgi:hypothetical protein
MIYLMRVSQVETSRDLARPKKVFVVMAFLGLGSGFLGAKSGVLERLFIAFDVKCLFAGT